MVKYKMKKVINISIIFTIFYSIYFSSDSYANSNEIENYVPLEVTVSTFQKTYKTNEVVQWNIKIVGGSLNGPNFDIMFRDSKGNRYTMYNIKSYSTSVNLDYTDPGTVTAYVTVHGGDKSATDSHTIKISDYEN